MMQIIQGFIIPVSRISRCGRRGSDHFPSEVIEQYPPMPIPSDCLFESLARARGDETLPRLLISEFPIQALVPESFVILGS